MTRALGGAFRRLAQIVVGIAMLWGFIIQIAIVNKAAGFWGVVIAFLLLPLAFTVAPWYALVAWGDLFPLVSVYGLLILAGILYWLGSATTKS